MIAGYQTMLENDPARAGGPRLWGRRRALRAAAALLGVALLATAWQSACAATVSRKVRVGVLKFGTATWELVIAARHGLGQSHGIDIEVVEFAAKDAAAIALQAGAVDLILTDWIWVAARRKSGADFTFSTHSGTVGALLAGPKSGVKTLADLQGKRIGIAGGPVDKNWLLLRAYGQKTLGQDLAQWAEPVFAAPPLLNELAKRGEVDAALNFWHYGARLKAAGFVELVRVSDILIELGFSGPPPLLGWTFKESWAVQDPARIGGFLRAMAEARQILATSDAAWDEIGPLTRAESPGILAALKTSYRQGMTLGASADPAAAAQALLRAVSDYGGLELAPLAEGVPDGTFWQPMD
jgi:NitT/TauT family transport system substrate-binding protein